MPLYRPFPRSPPPLSLAALSVFFLAGGCPFLSLSASKPIVAYLSLLPPISLFSSLFTLRPFSSRFSFPFFAICSLHLLRPQLFHLFLGQMPRLGATSPLSSLFLSFLFFLNESIAKDSSADDDRRLPLPLLSLLARCCSLFGRDTAPASKHRIFRE